MTGTGSPAAAVARNLIEGASDVRAVVSFDGTTAWRWYAELDWSKDGHAVTLTMGGFSSNDALVEDLLAAGVPKSAIEFAEG